MRYSVTVSGIPVGEVDFERSAPGDWLGVLRAAVAYHAVVRPRFGAPTADAHSPAEFRAWYPSTGEVELRDPHGVEVGLAAWRVTEVRSAAGATAFVFASNRTTDAGVRALVSPTGCGLSEHT